MVFAGAARRGSQDFTVLDRGAMSVTRVSRVDRSNCCLGVRAAGLKSAMRKLNAVTPAFQPAFATFKIGQPAIAIYGIAEGGRRGLHQLPLPY